MATLEESQKVVVREKLELFTRLIVSIFEDVGTVQPNKIAGIIIKGTTLTCEVVAPIAAAAATAKAGPVAGATTRAAINPLLSKIIENVITWIDERLSHKKKSEKIAKIFQKVKPDQLRKMFVETAVLIYYSFQRQFESVTDGDINWMGGLSNLAIDACKRIISYLLKEETQDPIQLSANLLTKALIKGESKEQKEIIQFLSATKPRRIITCKPSDIYEKVGIKIVENNGQLIGHYENQLFDKDFGYRWSFKWENKSWWTLSYTEEEGRKVPEDTRTSLKLEELEAKMAEILTNINKDDPNLQLDRIEDGLDTMKEDLNDIKTKLSSELPKTDQAKIFNVTPPVKTFTGRKNQLVQLNDKLKTQQKQVVVSQCVSISGLGGMGKSELARKYAWEKYGNPYEHCIWIDSETESSITQSFQWVAKKLKIPKTERSCDSETLVERNILDIVDDIYERFSRSKTLVIFDNVNEYREIKGYLPSNLFATDERPTIIITSRNKDWNIGDDGDVGLIRLDPFILDEALKFVKKVLEIKDEDKSHDTVICKLTEELCYFPLALRHAASYINQFARRKSLTKPKDFFNSAIENYLGKFRDPKIQSTILQFNTGDRYTETTYTTWQITFRNIEKHEANGPLAIRLVEVMAYLEADYLPLHLFLDLNENKEELTEAVRILDKYSIIIVEENQIECGNESDESYFFHNNTANIHRLVQQVIRLWLQEEKREEDVLRTVLTQIYDKVPKHRQAAIWSFACKYATLIDDYLCKKGEKSKPCRKLVNTLDHLIIDGGDIPTIRTILDYLEDNESLWHEICCDILNEKLVNCNHNGFSMEIIGHEKHIKDVVLFHAELFNALRHSNTEDLELFLQSFDKTLINSTFNDLTALGRFATNGNLSVVKILIENGADVNWPITGLGNLTALWSALNVKHLEIVEYLLDHGADTDVTFDGSWTLLHSASCDGYLNIVKRLVDTIGKNENGTDAYWRPLHLAVQNNQVEIVEYLTNNEIYRSAMKDHGQTLSRIAAERGSIQVVKYLIDNKLANVNETLLSTAVNNDQLDIVKYLLSDAIPDKVDINASNVSLICPPEIHIKILTLLRKYSDAVNNVQSGKSTLEEIKTLALASKRFEIINLLIGKYNDDMGFSKQELFQILSSYVEKLG